MKKAAFIFITALLVFFETGCATSGTAITGQKDPIALVSVISNRDINWKGEEPTNPNTFSFFGNSALRADPDMTLVSYADELINTAESLFRNAIDSTDLLNLVDKETVLSSRAYREARTNQPARTLVKASSYAFINSRDRNFPAALAGETGIGRVMFVEFDFTKSMYTGFGKNGECRADLDMTILILDSGGKILYNETFHSWSRSTIRVSGGVYSQSGLMELFEEAIDEAYIKLLESLA